MTFNLRLILILPLYLMLVVFVAPANSQPSVAYCLRVDGKVADPLTGNIRDTGYSDVHATASPDGAFIIEFRYKNGEPNTVALVDYASGAETTIGQGASRLSWSADSTQYAFLSELSDERVMHLTVGDTRDRSQSTVDIAVPEGARSSFLTHFSADGEYIGVAMSGSRTDFVFYNLPEMMLTTVQIPTSTIREFEWAPTGHAAGFIGRLQSDRSIVNVLSADMTWHLAYQIAGNGEFTNFIWSPDNTYIAVEYQQSHLDQTDILDHNRLLARFAGPTAAGTWDDGGTSILLWQQTGNGNSYDLIRFDVPTRQSTALAINVRETHPVSADATMLVAPVWRNSAREMLHLTLFRLDTGEQFPLAEFPPVSLYPGILVYWPPEGDAAAVVQRSDRPNETIIEREFRVRPDTMSIERSEEYDNIGAPLWAGDGRGYLQWRYRNGNKQVIWYDTHMGTETLVADNLARVDLMHVDERTGNLYYRWQDPDGQSGIALFEPDGSHLARWKTLGAATGVDESEFPFPLLLSPDNQQAVIYSSMGGEIVTQFFSVNGESVELPRTHHISLQPSQWSPDGKMFAYVSLAENDNSTVFVIDADGREIARFDDFPYLQFYGGLAWSLCGTEN